MDLVKNYQKQIKELSNKQLETDLKKIKKYHAKGNFDTSMEEAFQIFKITELEKEIKSRPKPSLRNRIWSFGK